MAKVLVIDDDQDVTRFLQEQLAEDGHSVTVAHQGDEGLARAVESVPDLIMLDVFLPDSTGFQVCSQIRKNPSTQAVPIIMMTGAARFPNQKLMGLERGANEYISKPFDVIEVGDLVHKYLGASAGARRSHTLAVHSPVEPADDLAELSAFLNESAAKMKPAQANAAHYVERIPEALLPVVHPSQPPIPASETIRNIPFPAPSVPPSAQAPVQTREDFLPTILSAKERFIDFGMEIYALATRLSSTHAEQYLADQLLRSSLSVGARLTESRAADNRTEFLQLLHIALKDMRETGHWLMITHKTGLLDQLGKTDLEKTCQSLTTLLTDFVNAEKKRSSR